VFEIKGKVSCGGNNYQREQSNNEKTYKSEYLNSFIVMKNKLGKFDCAKLSEAKNFSRIIFITIQMNNE